MKLLTVVALVCAMMVLTEAAGEETHLEKRTCCSHGWTKIGNRCFRYIPYAMSWARAERYCLALGGNLASIHSKRQYLRVQWLIRKACHGYRNAWVGGSDAEQNNYWFWSDGTRFRYSYWCRGEPNNGGGRQHCLQINYSGCKCWDDFQCYNRLPFVCAKRLH